MNANGRWVDSEVRNSRLSGKPNDVDCCDKKLRMKYMGTHVSRVYLRHMTYIL